MCNNYYRQCSCRFQSQVQRNKCTHKKGLFVPQPLPLPQSEPPSPCPRIVSHCPIHHASLRAGPGDPGSLSGAVPVPSSPETAWQGSKCVRDAPRPYSFPSCPISDLQRLSPSHLNKAARSLFILCTAQNKPTPTGKSTGKNSGSGQTHPTSEHSDQ